MNHKHDRKITLFDISLRKCGLVPCIVYHNDNYFKHAICYLLLYLPELASGYLSAQLYTFELVFSYFMQQKVD